MNVLLTVVVLVAFIVAARYLYNRYRAQFVDGLEDSEDFAFSPHDVVTYEDEDVVTFENEDEVASEVPEDLRIPRVDESFTYRQLRQHATEYDVRGRAQMTKAELIEAINAA